MKRPIRDLIPQLTTRNFIVLSAVMVVLVYVVQGDVDFHIPDEGFLWYGTMRTALGEVPVRDFQSYEPGRYYWGALWLKLLSSDGILALRISQAAFQFIGLTLALVLLRRLVSNWLALIFAVAILVRWMVPIWKIYEPVIEIAAVFFAVLVIEQPSLARHLMAGIFTGLAAFFGRNHGLYCGLAFLLLTIFLGWKIDKRVLVQRLSALALGVVIGYAPMLFMFAFVPGFFTQFKNDIFFNIHYGTNLPIPVPWPWRQSYADVGVREAINRFAIGMLFLLLPALYLFAFARLLFKRTAQLHPVFIASAFVGLMYLHYTFGRPQHYYLQWTIPPFILGMIALPASLSKTKQASRTLVIAVWSMLAVFTLAALEFSQENYFTLKAKAFTKAKLMGRSGGDFDRAMIDKGLAKTDVGGDHLWLTLDTSSFINTVTTIDRNLIRRDDGLLVVPYLSGLYAALHKRSPTWEIYFLFPRPIEEQETMVQDLKNRNVDWAFICHSYVDKRPELQFQFTHSFVWQYLTENFETIHAEETRKLYKCELMRRRQ